MTVYTIVITNSYTKDNYLENMVAVFGNLDDAIKEFEERSKEALVEFEMNYKTEDIEHLYDRIIKEDENIDFYFSVNTKEEGTKNTIIIQLLEREIV